MAKNKSFINSKSPEKNIIMPQNEIKKMSLRRTKLELFGKIAIVILSIIWGIFNEIYYFYYYFTATFYFDWLKKIIIYSLLFCILLESIAWSYIIRKQLSSFKELEKIKFEVRSLKLNIQASCKAIGIVYSCLILVLKEILQFFYYIPTIIGLVLITELKLLGFYMHYKFLCDYKITLNKKYFNFLKLSQITNNLFNDQISIDMLLFQDKNFTEQVEKCIILASNQTTQSSQFFFQADLWRYQRHVLAFQVTFQAIPALLLQITNNEICRSLGEKTNYDDFIIVLGIASQVVLILIFATNFVLSIFFKEIDSYQKIEQQALTQFRKRKALLKEKIIRNLQKPFSNKLKLYMNFNSSLNINQTQELQKLQLCTPYNFQKIRNLNLNFFDIKSDNALIMSSLKVILDQLQNNQPLNLDFSLVKCNLKLWDLINMFKMINQINHYTNTKKFGVNIGNYDVIESFNNQYPNLQNQKEDQEEEEQESVYNILKFNFSQNNFYYKDLNTKLLQRKSLKKRQSIQQIQQQQKLNQNQEKQDQDQNDDKDIIDQIDLPFSLDKIDEKFQQKINFIEANSKLNIFFFNEIQYDFQFCNVQQLLFFNLLESKCEKLTINVSYNPQILFNTRLEQNRNQLELVNQSNNNPSSIHNIQPNTQIVDQIPTLKDQINIQIHKEEDEENNEDENDNDCDQINQNDENYKNEQKTKIRDNKNDQNENYQKNNIQDYKGSISPQENIKVDETEDYEKQESNRVLLKKFETKLELVKNQTSNTSINYQQQVQENVNDQDNKNLVKKEEKQQAILNNKVSQNQLRKKKRKIQTTLTKDKNYLELNSYVNYENIQQDLFIFGELDKLCTLFDDQQSKSINSLQLNLLKANTNNNIQQTLKHSPSAQNGSAPNFTVCDLQTQLQFTSLLYFKELRITMQHNYLDNKGLSKFFGLLSKNSSLNTLYMDISLNDITDNIFYLMLKNEIIDQTIPSVEYLEINISNNSLSDLILGFYSFYYLILNLFNKLKTLKINVSNNPKMNCILKEIMKAQEINANYLSPKNRKQFFSSLKPQQISSYLCYQRENMTQLENLSIDFSECNIGNPGLYFIIHKVVLPQEKLQTLDINLSNQFYNKRQQNINKQGIKYFIQDLVTIYKVNKGMSKFNINFTKNYLTRNLYLNYHPLQSSSTNQQPIYKQLNQILQYGIAPYKFIDLNVKAYQGEQNQQNLKIFHDKNIILDQNSLKIKHIKDQKYMVGRQINNFKNVKKQQKNIIKNKQIDICLPINDNLVAQKHFQIFYYNHCVFVKPFQNKPVFHLLENKNQYSIFNFQKFYIGNPQDKSSIEIQISCLPQNYNQQVIRDELLTVATSKNTKLKNIQNKYQHLIPIDDYLAEYLESYNLTLSNKVPQQMHPITENTMKLSKTSIITNNQKNTVSEIDTFSELPKENQLTTYQQLQSPQSHALLSPQQQTTQQLLPKLDSDNQIQQHLSDQEHIEYLKKKNLSDLNGQVKNLMKKKRKFSQQAPPLKNFCENNKIQNNIKISNKQSLQFLKQPNSNIFLQKNFPYLFAPKEQSSDNNSQNQKLQQPYNEHLTTTIDSKQKPAQQQQQKDLKYFVTNNQKKNSSLSSFNSNFQNPMSTNKEVFENQQDRPIKKYLLQKNSNSQNELYIHYRSEQDDLGQQEHKSLNYYEDFEQEVTIQVKLQNVTQIHKFKLEKGQYFTIGTSPTANDIFIAKNHKIFQDIKLNNQGDFNLCQIGRSPEGIWYISKKQNIENLDLFYQYGDNENKDIIKQQQKKNNQDIYQIKKESRILIGNNLLTVNNISINKSQSKK